MGIALTGCGRAPEKQGRSSLKVHIPCVLSGPMHEVVAAYQSAHPEVDVSTKVDKPLAMVSHVQASHDEPAAVITMGDVEMQSLVRAGAVESGDVRTIAVNTYSLVVVVPANGVLEVKTLTDLARPEARRIFVADPSQSSLGDRAERAFRNLGLWEAVGPKIVRPNPDAMVLGEMLAGKAEASVVFKDCLFADRESGGAPPRTIRIVGELPQDAYPSIPYQAAALKTAPRPEVAREFVGYLVSTEGKKALREAGLRPTELP